MTIFMWMLNTIAKMFGKEITSQAVKKFMEQKAGIAPVVLFISAATCLLLFFAANPFYSPLQLSAENYSKVFMIPYSILILAICTIAYKELKSRR